MKPLASSSVICLLVSLFPISGIAQKSLLFVGGTSSYNGVSDPAHALGGLNTAQSSFTNLSGPLSTVTFADGSSSSGTGVTVAFGSSGTYGGAISWTTPAVVNTANLGNGPGIFQHGFGGSEVRLSATVGDLGIRVSNLPAGVYDVYYAHSSGTGFSQTAKVNIGFNLTSINDPSGLNWAMTPVNTSNWSAALGPTEWDSSGTGCNCIRQRIRITNPSTQAFTLITEDTTAGGSSKCTGLEFVAIPTADASSIGGSGNFTTADTGTTLYQKINALRSAGAMTCRVGLLPSSDYYVSGTAGVSAGASTLINTLIAQGITPYVHFEYYQNEYGWSAGPILSYNWTAIGRAFATTFGSSVPYYAAVNEPDLAVYSGGTNAVIPPADYATALGNLASGVHAVNPSIKVIPGGYGLPSTYHIWTCGGYPAAIASLVNSGALDGIDLHIYWGSDAYTPITNWSLNSLQSQFQNVKSSCGLGDIKLYCTEFNQSLVSGTDQYAVNEAQAAQRLLTLIWSVLGTTKSDNSTPNMQIALLWSLVELQGSYGAYTTLAPWMPNPRGITTQLVLALTSGMQFSSFTNGGITMTGSNKKLWVIENISSWKTVSANYTCLGIPPNTARLLRYGYDGLRETVSITTGTDRYPFADIPSGETTMIEALPAGSGADVVTGAATGTTYQSATLNGLVNPNGLPTGCYFQYGLTPAYGSVMSSQVAGSGTSATGFSAPLTGLASATTYHCLLTATNINGTSHGNDQTFTTADPPPALTAGTATETLYNGATISSTVNPNGLATTCYVQYGTSSGYGSSTVGQSVGSGTGGIPVSVTITGLSSATTYHYRIVTSNSSGTSYGSDQTFTTTQALGFATTNAQIGSSGTGAQVRIQGFSGYGYQLQYTGSLSTATVWQNIGSAQSGSNGLLILSDTAGSLSGSGFYRIQISQ